MGGTWGRGKKRRGGRARIKGRLGDRGRVGKAERKRGTAIEGDAGGRRDVEMRSGKKGGTSGGEAEKK